MSSTELAPADVVSPRRRPLAFELVFVVLVAMCVLIPGIWRYSLVDPWETHYGEVAREMLQNNDWVHTEWRGTMDGNPNDNEGFRSKPVLQFWLMAASMRAFGVVENGGYSGEMTDSALIMVAIRMPFILCAIAGLTLVWWMLARLVSRRLAWLALLVVGTIPMFAMISRNAIPDMPLVACTMGAIALFTMAVEDGARPIHPLFHFTRRRIPIDARHVVFALAGGFVLVQAIYYAVHFAQQPGLGVRGRIPNPALWLPLMMVFVLAALHRDFFLIVRLPSILVGGIIAAIVNEPMPRRSPGQSRWRHFIDNILVPWERHVPDRYITRFILWPFAWLLAFRPGKNWETTKGWVDRLFIMRPITQMRQVYLVGCYFLLGVSLLAKGPPGLMVVGAVGALHVLLLGRWRELVDGDFEIKRGLLLIAVVAIPWHVAMYLRDGIRFLDEYLMQHILNRAAVGVDNSPGTFAFYTHIIGHGMWLWAALIPPALAATLMRARTDSREGRVRFMIGLWAVVAASVFCLVQTKFNHYFLPAIPPLGLLVAFLLEDIASKRERLHPLWIVFGIGIVFLTTRDLMFEPERWIEMFVFRYDRPWPSQEPWSVDTSDGFLLLGVAAAIAMPLLATRFSRIAVAAYGTVAIAATIFALQVYMPIAGTHWGMRDALAKYYEMRTVYGQKLVYYGAGQLYADWHDVKDAWTFETKIPDTLHQGQPMTITVVLNKAEDERVTEQELVLVGKATSIGDHSITVTLAPGERAKLQPLVERGKKGSRRARPPLRTVDADRLIGWQLYWRGENFWSGGEIWAILPEQKTQFNKVDNVEFNKYLNDRTRAPLGRRYFIVTEAGRINSARSLLPTPRGRDSFEVLDTTSNKFSLAAFWL
ncbi:MAG: ArnT family glycosyltransferase [Kofleriaceae bacterium]